MFENIRLLGVQSAFQMIQVQASRVLPHKTWQIVSSWTSLGAQGRCRAGTGVGLLVPQEGNCNCNATAYKVQRCASKFAASVQFGEDSHISCDG